MEMSLQTVNEPTEETLWQPSEETNTHLRLSDSFTERLWSQVCLER